MLRLDFQNSFSIDRQVEPTRAARRSRRSLSRKRLTQLEKLEPRHLLASDIIISEVLTSNDTGIKDDDGTTSDWIELYNVGHEKIDLGGWHLTDDVDERTKWTLPSTTLDPGAALIVFASGKDKTDPAGTLHTNFRLSRGGEYLGLYMPDGRTVASEIRVIPDQYTDISYGVSQSLTERPFVDVGAAASVLVPQSAGQDLPAATWTAPTFDASAWQKLNTGLGYDADATDGEFGSLIHENGNLSSIRGKSSSAYVRTEFDIPGDFLPTYKQLDLTVNFDDGFVAYLNGQPVLNVNSPELLQWNSSATSSHGGIADEISYPSIADPLSRGDFTLKGNASWVDGALRLTNAAADQNSAVWRTQPVAFGSDYTFSASMVFDIHSPGGALIDGDGLGGEGMTFVLQGTDSNVLGTGGSSLGLENTGMAFLAIELDSNARGAFDPDTNLNSHIGINTHSGGSLSRVAIPRFNGNSFFAGDPPPGRNFQYLWVDYTGETQLLNVYYATTNTKPATPTLSTTVDLSQLFVGNPSLTAGWTASTSSAFNGHDVRSFEITTGVGELGRESVMFSLNNHLDKLQTGKNVLAFHALNVSANDEDFLLVPKLTAQEVNVSPTSNYFVQPTPGELNGIATDPPSGPVTISKGTHIFKDPFTVEIAGPSPNAVIRYTTDGTIPIETSTVYSGPITIDAATRLRARAFEPNRAPGEISTAGYIQADPSVVEFEGGKPFESNLPLIIIDSFGNRRADSSDRQLVPSLGVFIDTGEDGRAGIFDTPQHAGRTGIRIRGQSSQGWAKKQYALELVSESETDDTKLIDASAAPDMDVSLFGLPADSDWVMNGPYADKTQLNNYLSFLWSNKIGLYSPRAKLIEVFVNHDGGTLDMRTSYRGTYVLLEKIKISDDRINITKIEPGDDTEPEITGGYVWKKDKDGYRDVNFTTSKQTFKMVEPAFGEITDAQKNWLDNHITEFETVLYGRNFADPKNGYAKYIDVDSWVDMWLLVEMTKNIDGFRLSTYYYMDRNGKINQGPGWDYNLSLANANYLKGGYPEGWYGELLGDGDYPYWRRLFEDPKFEQRVIDRWHELRQGVWSTENLLKDADAALKQLSNGNPNYEKLAAGEPSNPISRNYARWTTGAYGLNKYHWPNCFFGVDDCPRSPLENASRPDSFSDYAFILNWFIENRMAWIDGEFRPEVIASPESGLVDRLTQVTLTGPAGHELYYTLDGTDPQQPLLIDEFHTVLGANQPVQYLIPTDDSLIMKCQGRRVTDPATCFLNPDYVQGANGETWTAGTLGVGFDTGSAFDSSITTDLESNLRGKNSSIYFRIPFQVTPEMRDNATGLKLDARFDDGFVAYMWHSSLRAPNEIARANAPGTGARYPITIQSFNANATANRSDTDAVAFQSFDLTATLQTLRDGQNYLFIQALNDDANSEDFLFDARLTLTTTRSEVSPSRRPYTGPITIDRGTQIVARALNPVNDRWTRAVIENYIVDTSKLAITEINYNPAPPTATELAADAGLVNDDFEFVEIKNLADTSTNLLSTQFTNGIEFEFGSVELAAGSHGLLVKNRSAFELRYGTGKNIVGEYGGSLDNNGERISVTNVAGQLIADFTYGDGELWPAAADGLGATLQLKDPEATPPSLWNKFYNWRSSTEFGGSPGSAGAGAVGVVVNEVLSHTDPPIDLTDSIELLNTTNSPIDVSGWAISDSSDNFLKYRIANGTVIGPNSTLVLDERHFNADPASPNSFALDGTDGDDVWVVIPTATGGIQSFVDDVHFRAALNGESFGRYPQGVGRLAPMSQRTLGAANAYPRVGPAVISELVYNPPEPSAAALAVFADLTAADLEFVEVHNPTPNRIDTTDWRIRGGIDHNFSLGSALNPGSTVVVISFDPLTNPNRLAAFRAHYGIGETVRIVGGYQGGLSSNGDRVTLLSRDLSFINEPIVLPQIIEDEVIYDNMGQWPTEADGEGMSLQRRAPGQYGNLAMSWQAGMPSPGSVNFVGVIPGDFDSSGLVDANDINLLCGQVRSGNGTAQFDLTGDGAVNLADHEFLIEQVLRTSAGDASLDGIFDSRDLVMVIQQGQYEDSTTGNSTWTSGDWNCDSEFNSRDIVDAFVAGSYVAEAVGASSSGSFQDVAAGLTSIERSALSRDADRTTFHDNRFKLVDGSRRSPFHLADIQTVANVESHDRYFADSATDDSGTDIVDDDIVRLLL